MEPILQGLQSNQIPTKVKALEDLVIKLENPKILTNAMVSINLHLDLFDEFLDSLISECVYFPPQFI
jgi:hypothetical protein